MSVVASTQALVTRWDEILAKHALRLSALGVGSEPASAQRHSLGDDVMVTYGFEESMVMMAEKVLM